MKTATEKVEISIIIPTLNEETNISNCLLSIHKQKYRNFEVIIVDDFSSDNTVKMAEEFNVKHKINLRIVKQIMRKERGAARNIGARKARGRYLFFIDADMILETNVLSQCINFMKKQPVVKGIVIPENSFGDSFWANCRKLEKQCYLGDDSIEAARFFTKDAFWKVGGWDEEMVSGEDWDLTKRIKVRYSVGRINDLILHNEGKLDLAKVIRKKFYYATKASIYLKKYPLSIKGILIFIFRPAYFRNWKILLGDPYHSLGLFFMKSIEIASGGAGFIYSRVFFLFRQ